MTTEFLLLALLSFLFWLTDYRERQKYQCYRDALAQTCAQYDEILELDRRSRETRQAVSDRLQSLTIGIDQLLQLDATLSRPEDHDAYGEHIKLVMHTDCPCGGSVFLTNPIQQLIVLGTSKPVDIACHWVCCVQCGRVTLLDKVITERLMRKNSESPSA